jgi:hypothetical protein
MAGAGEVHPGLGMDRRQARERHRAPALQMGGGDLRPAQAGGNRM